MAKTKPFSQMDDDLKKKANEIVQAFRTTAPQAVGVVAVNGFKKSFDLQKFNDAGEQKWEEVERRKPESGWYGFQYRNKKNFSSAATTRQILRGSGSSSLQQSIRVKSARAGRVVIGTDKPYAQVHNEGGMAKVFGKWTFTMPKRKFMGHSNTIDKDIKRVLDKMVNKIMK